MNKEKGKIPRAKVEWLVVVEQPEGDVTGVITVITPNEAFIRCARPLNLNEVFSMTINAPNRSPFTVKAEVVWSNIHGYDDAVTPRGMGVRFLDIKSECRMFIAAVLEGQGVEKVADNYLKTLNKVDEDIDLDIT